MVEDTQRVMDWMKAQPYEEWAEIRESGCPVAPYAGNDFDSRTSYHVTGFAAVETVLRDPEAFSSSINAEVIGQFMGELILAMSGAEHKQYRNMVAKAFRASQLEQWDDTLVKPLIAELLDEIAPLGRADLVAAITSRYPARVICSIVGVPTKDADQFAEWAVEINTGPLMPERGHAASEAMVEYLRPLVEARRETPTGDFLSDLVHCEIDGEQLTDGKIYGFLRLLLPAGAETTYRVMGNCLYAILTVPGAYEKIRADYSLLPAAIEETLRWETSVTMVSRISTRDVEVAGCPIPAGSPVNAMVGAADRDPAHYTDPDSWRLDRPAGNHLAFGTGPHQCLGMHLARLELRVGLEAILDRLPNLRLDPDAPMPAIEGFAFRGPNALPVLFDAS